MFQGVGVWEGAHKHFFDRDAHKFPAHSTRFNYPKKIEILTQELRMTQNSNSKK